VWLPRARETLAVYVIVSDNLCAEDLTVLAGLVCRRFAARKCQVAFCLLVISLLSARECVCARGLCFGCSLPNVASILSQDVAIVGPAAAAAAAAAVYLESYTREARFLTRRRRRRSLFRIVHARGAIPGGGIYLES
jgi:hypothetical protein